MKKRNLDKVVIILCNFFVAITAHSQNHFAYKATLGEIKETKFYKIDLSPQIVAKCKAGLPDIRIYDENGREASYILKNDLPAFKRENLTEFPVTTYIKDKDKQTHVILRNITGKPVSNLLLFIKNTDARRFFSVSGSDDSLHWFIIKENISLENAFNKDGQNFIQALSFPSSDYRYFQLTILGENLLPFNIVKAGIYDEDLVYGKYIKIPAPGILQKDSSNKKSYISIHFDDKYQIHKINFEVRGIKYFKRKLSLYYGNKPGDDILPGNYLGSDSTNSYSVNCKNSQLLAVIENEDNPPLRVTAVDAFQLNTALLTYLQAGEKYHINFSDSTLEAPQYDLRFFADSIGKELTEIPVTGMEKEKEISKSETKSVPKNNRWMLWTAMILIFIILCLFTFKMLRDVNKKTV